MYAGIIVAAAEDVPWLRALGVSVGRQHDSRRYLPVFTDGGMKRVYYCLIRNRLRARLDEHWPRVRVCASKR